MKRILPAVFAFLLCFAGGMAMGPKRDDSAGRVALQTQLPGGGPLEAGMKKTYDDWVRQGKEREKLESDLATIRGEIDRLKADDAAMEKVLAAIRQAEQDIKKIDAELDKVEKEIVELDLKGLSAARERMAVARKKVDDAVAAMPVGADGRVAEKDFAKRLEWVKTYRKIKEDYDKEIAVFNAELKKRTTKSGGEGGKP